MDEGVITSGALDASSDTSSMDAPSLSCRKFSDPVVDGSSCGERGTKGVKGLARPSTGSPLLRRGSHIHQSVEKPVISGNSPVCSRVLEVSTPGPWRWRYGALQAEVRCPAGGGTVPWRQRSGAWHSEPWEADPSAGPTRSHNGQTKWSEFSPSWGRNRRPPGRAK
ncbi:hypothetical protein FKM82_018104 [Ascaphus truei]